MNYDEFRTTWHRALNEAGLLRFPAYPSETIELRWLRREYGLDVRPHDQPARPFHVSARLSWVWDAATAARTATTEEDLLVELLGQDGYYLVTEQPWLRVDVKLRATLPVDSPLPMPDAAAWRRWAEDATTRLAPLLPIEGMDEDEDDPDTLSWRGKPQANLACAPDGQLYLAGVELSAWQGIDLPRQWDNPDRLRDGHPHPQLAAFARRLRRALDVWGDGLSHLKP